jgi:hypothetical protein
MLTRLVKPRGSTLGFIINDPTQGEESPSFPRSPVGTPSPTLGVVRPSTAGGCQATLKLTPGVTLKLTPLLHTC